MSSPPMYLSPASERPGQAKAQGSDLHYNELAVAQAKNIQVSRLLPTYGPLGVVSQFAWSLTGGLPKVAPCYTPGALSERTPQCLQRNPIPASPCLCRARSCIKVNGHRLSQPLTCVRDLSLTRPPSNRGYHPAAGPPPPANV